MLIDSGMWVIRASWVQRKLTGIVRHKVASMIPKFNEISDKINCEVDLKLIVFVKKYTIRIHKIIAKTFCIQPVKRAFNAVNAKPERAIIILSNFHLSL